MKDTLTLSDFLEALRTHDWLYAYSDDNRWYKRGKAQEEAIYAMLEKRPEWWPLFKLFAKYTDPDGGLTLDDFSVEVAKIMKDLV